MSHGLKDLEKEDQCLEWGLVYLSETIATIN